MSVAKGGTKDFGRAGKLQLPMAMGKCQSGASGPDSYEPVLEGFKELLTAGKSLQAWRKKKGSLL